MDRQRPSPTVPTETVIEMGRLKGLSDAVVAIALTLLVLEIRVPADVDADDLPAAIGELGPQFAVYLLSFVVIGGAWGSHQRLLGQIGRGGGLLIWLTLLSLLPVTLVPASAALLGDHPSAPAAITVFAVDVVAIQLTAWLLWRHASRNGFIDASLDERVVESIGRRLVFSAACFAVSIPLALISIPIVYAVWVGTFALIFATDWLSWQQARRAIQATIPLEDARRARIWIRHGAGHLDLRASEDPTVLAEGSFGGGVTSEVARADGLADVRLTQPGRSALLSPRYPWAWGPANLLDWDAALSARVPIELTIDTAGGQATLNLERLQLAALRVKTSASSIDASLPTPSGIMAVGIEASATSIVVRVPDGVATSIRATKSIASVDVDLERFPMIVNGRHYESPDFESASNRLEITAEFAFGSLRVVGPGAAADDP